LIEAQRTRSVWRLSFPSVTRVSTPREWDELNKKLDLHVRRLLKDGYDVELG
jgi:hypothetical protein